MKNTPPKTNIEPENHLFEKENHLPNLHFGVPCWFFVVYPQNANFKYKFDNPPSAFCLSSSSISSFFLQFPPPYSIDVEISLDITVVNQIYADATSSSPVKVRAFLTLLNQQNLMPSNVFGFTLAAASLI